MESNIFELERPSQLTNISHLSKYSYEFTKQDYYLYNGVSSDVFNSFKDEMNRVSKGELSKTSIIIFLNYLWGYLTLEDIISSFNISKNEFIAIFHKVLDCWNRIRESENLSGLRDRNGILNIDSCSSVLLINLFFPINDDHHTIKNNNLFYSEQYNQNGIKIQLIVIDNMLVSIDGFHFGSQDDIICSGINEEEILKHIQEINLLVNENEIETKLAHYKILTLRGDNVRDILAHVSRFSILNKKYRGDPDDILSIFEIIFYLSKLYIKSSLD